MKKKRTDERHVSEGESFFMVILVVPLSDLNVMRQGGERGAHDLMLKECSENRCSYRGT